MEIGGLKSEQSTAVKRSQHIIAHLDNLVDAVRDRLHGRTISDIYNLADSIGEVVEFAKYKSTGSRVGLTWKDPKDKKIFNYLGDPIKFSQVVTILVNNAVEASSKKKGVSSVLIHLEHTGNNIIIKVTDHGVGIKQSERKHVFKSTYTTKSSSMGIGLYLAKQIVESQFAGTLELSKATDRTEFVITLPLSSHTQEHYSQSTAD
jgi:signal transduction histidine kinase